MRVLKKRGKYLEEKAKLSTKFAKVILLIGLVSTIVLKNIVLLFIAFIISFYFFENAWKYRRGIAGEELVEESLQELSDEYFLLNDITLPQTRMNIDHLILGPNGIFVIEAKNYDGKIVCYGDT